MRVFLTGASGWIGSVVWRELIAAGHDVVGLVRSEGKGAALAKVRGTVLVGSLADRDVLRCGAEDADGIIHTAFGLDMSRIDDLAAEDRQAIEFFGELFAGSTRPIIVTDGFLHVTGDKAGEAYHAVAEEGVPFRQIAEAVGRQLGLPARSLTPAEAEGHFGPLATWVANNGPASNEWTRKTLDWTPEQPGIIADIERPNYSPATSSLALAK
jgi:nucleoside-diphosphate-sugar epimerase